MSRASSLPSDRSFGGTFVAVFFLMAGWAVWTDRLMPAGAYAALGAVTLMVTLTRPSLLHPMNRAWMKVGSMLHTIVNPIVLGAIYFVVITPVGVAMRMARRDVLRRRMEPDILTYWIEREPPGPAPDSLPHQF